ncbi:MAG: metallopeptidase TldD-related protein [Bacteroidales bacterium]|nr:metallopeptidase TldD-related protein [Bacteroidales bacterium]
MKHLKKLYTLILLLFIGFSLHAGDALLRILKDELQYQFTQMQKTQPDLYYMDFHVTDQRVYQVTTSFGATNQTTRTHVRNFVPSLRIGTMEFDNQIDPRQTATIPGQRAVRLSPLPLENDPLAIRQAIWNETFIRYQRAIGDLQRATDESRLQLERSDTMPSFSAAPVEIHFEPVLTGPEIEFDMEQWAERLRNVSAVFLNHGEFIRGNANVTFRIRRTYFINTEGTSVVQNLTYSQISVNAMLRAEDGMELPLHTSFFAFLPENLPSEEELIAAAEDLARRLLVMRTAPLVSPFTGPALLSGAASGVFFHEIFGHRIEGQKMKSDRDGQTFKRMVGEYVLPPTLSVFDDPTMRQYGGRDLNGFYIFDDQGVRGERVVVVENGILRNFLMTRTPIDGFPRSTGHGRAEMGFDPDSRQSNLIISTSDPKSDEELRRLLIEEAIAQGREFGYFFKTVSGGFTQTGARAINAFNVTPLEVYRIYVDGRPDVMVRGVDLIGTPLSMFSRITYAGKPETAEIFIGNCGAGSGWVPVSSVSPTILVRQVEVQSKPRTMDREPILPRP